MNCPMNDSNGWTVLKENNVTVCDIVLVNCIYTAMTGVRYASFQT